MMHELLYKRCLLKLGVLTALAAVGLCWLMEPRHGTAAQTASAERLFLEKVWPVIEAQCLACHSGAGAQSQLDLTSRAALLKGGTRGASVVPGNAALSPLLSAIEGKSTLQIPHMPPGRAKQLPAETVEAFRPLIDAGAPWPQPSAQSKATDDTWAFRPVRRVNVPALKQANPVDNFILQKLNESKLPPAPAADRATLIRRATFDLHGLPPAAEEVEAFVRDSLPTPQAFEKVVERLLDSPRYGERWGRHWLDVVRYADTGGGSNDYERPHAWRYRDYVIRSFNQDKPYDQFIREQLAGDELNPQNTEYLIATGFLRMGPWEHTSMSVEAVTRQEWLDDVTHNTGTAFLGLTMGCAKCHDHKFDPIPTRDYYRWQAVFATTRFAERPAPFLPAENISRAAEQQARLEPRYKRTQEKYNQLALALNKKPRTQFANQAGNAANQAAAQPQAVPQKELKDLGADPQRVELLELERAYVKRVEFTRLALRRFVPQAFSVTSDAGSTPNKDETFILVGGNLNTPGTKVTPGVLEMADCGLQMADCGKIPATAAGRRLALAQWIASPSNPLTARVLVNRIWQYHFGKGLVETSNNFGKLGKRPSHPELLDWLANYFVEQGWSVKALHRLLMNSAVYQRASRYSQPELAAKADPTNRLLAYFPPRRVEAEVLRDTLLMVAGELNLEAGGPGTFPELNADLVAQPRLIMGTVAPAWEASPTRAERNRRTIYTFQQRSVINPLVEVFNGANLNESCEFRRTSTIAPQVFNLFNSQFSYDVALAFAQRLERATRERRAQIELAFRLAYQRPPSGNEMSQALAHLAVMTKHHQALKPPPLAPLKPVEQSVNSEYSGLTIRFVEDTDFTNYERNLHPSQVAVRTRALAELCLVLMNANEFVYVY